VLQGPIEPSQFRSHAFIRTLRAAGLVGSMGRVGACGDNAAMESFFALLQKNVLDRRRWATREDLQIAPSPSGAATAPTQQTAVTAASDDSARWLAVAGLLVALAALAVALLNRRRRGQAPTPTGAAADRARV
jgi:transposase InsO family protein